jgi:hypothetical protein
VTAKDWQKIIDDSVKRSVVRCHTSNFENEDQTADVERVNQNNLPSYLGLLKHCNGYKLSCELVKAVPKLDSFID